MSWTASIDGGSRGNPGPAGAGVHIRDEAGAVVFAGGFFLGRMTNNQAEYRSLLAALDLLHRAGAGAIEIVSDSELMVRQINGSYRVKSAGLKPLFDKARHRLKDFEGWEMRHVRREQNAQADRLANQAMDARTHVTVTDRLGLAPPARPARPPSSAPAGLAGSPVVEVVVTRGPGRHRCPGGIRRGQSFLFTDVAATGLCVDACSAVIDAVMALREAGRDGAADDAAMTPRCPRADCGAVFEVRLQQG